MKFENLNDTGNPDSIMMRLSALYHSPIFVLNQGPDLFILIDNNFHLDSSLYEIPRLVKHITGLLCRLFSKFQLHQNIPRPLERKMVVFCHTILLWELFALVDTASLRISLFKLLQAEAFFRSFYCACGVLFPDASLLKSHRIKEHQKVSEFLNDCRLSIKENSGKSSKHPLNLDFHQVWLKHVGYCRMDREENLCKLVKVSLCLNEWQTVDPSPSDRAVREGKQREMRIKTRV